MDFILGNEEKLNSMNELAGMTPFSEKTIEFCQIVSKELMKAPSGRMFPDVTTLGFWLRKASLLELGKRFVREDTGVVLGKGVAFHVAPSNVPVNFAYSLFSGLLCGNANVVRIPSKDFPQIPIIVKAIETGIKELPEFGDRICLVRYGHDQADNDLLSSICDVRIIWGGDNTISEIRKSPLPPRSTEVTFADRYSLAVIDIDAYTGLDDKEKEILARGFYNDTYLTDQNACTSPRVICWLDKNKTKETEVVIEEFWDRLWNIVDNEYQFQDIQGVNKLTKQYILAAVTESAKRIKKDSVDNRLVRVEVDKLGVDRSLFDNSGYFIEYKTDDIMSLRGICDDNHCQTISFLGDKEMLMPLLNSGIKGVDRVVPIGKTMDFDLIWDGMNLYEMFTRKISV